MELFLAENHSFPQKFLRIGIQSDPKNASWSGWWWFELVPFTLHRGAVCVWSGLFNGLWTDTIAISPSQGCVQLIHVQSMSTGYQLGSPQYSIHKGLKEKNMWIISGWWFQNMVYFHPKNWGSFPFWLIFFKGVETTKDRNKLPPPLATLIVYSFNIRNSLRLCERFFKSARTANCSVGLKILKSPKKSSALCVNSGDRCGPQKKVVLYRGYLPKTHGPHFNHWKTGEIWAKSPTMFVSFTVWHSFPPLHEWTAWLVEAFAIFLVLEFIIRILVCGCYEHFYGPERCGWQGGGEVIGRSGPVSFWIEAEKICWQLDQIFELVSRKLRWYCWWLKSCTSWYGQYPIFTWFCTIPRWLAGCLPSTVWLYLVSSNFGKLSKESSRQPCGLDLFIAIDMELLTCQKKTRRILP